MTDRCCEAGFRLFDSGEYTKSVDGVGWGFGYNFVRVFTDYSNKRIDFLKNVGVQNNMIRGPRSDPIIWCQTTDFSSCAWYYFLKCCETGLGYSGHDLRSIHEAATAAGTR